MGTVGENIFKARKQAGLTQEELAERVGYKTKSAINKIEMGLRDLPQKKIVAFAKALNTTPAYLMGWEEAIQEEPVETAERHIEMIMDADLNEIYDYLKIMDDSKRKIAKGLIKSLAETEMEA